MVDTELLIRILRKHGHTVQHAFPVPDNAGDYEFEVDGNILTLEEVRALIDADEARRPVKASPSVQRSTS